MAWTRIGYGASKRPAAAAAVAVALMPVLIAASLPPLRLGPVRVRRLAAKPFAALPVAALQLEVLPLVVLPALVVMGLLLGASAEAGTASISPASISPASISPAASSPASVSPAPAPAWLNRPGHSFWESRPWVYGWYRVHPEVWSWWSASSARWGLANLAPAATITGLVQAALSSGNTVIVVPGGTERLDIGSLQAVRPMGVRFQYAGEGLAWSPGSADCQAGLLAGLPPRTPLEAQRLNAACQLTYGNP